jgi:cytidyltransferase-like protein
MITGYTVGTFDLFHIGHLRLLQAAKGLCDRLIVGVNTEKILGYKPRMPTIPFEERFEIIKGLRCVDTVVPVYYRDPVVDYFRLKYNRLFIGSDWYDTELWKDYEYRLKDYDVNVVYLPYTENVSSTAIIDKIIKENNETIGLLRHPS